VKARANVRSMPASADGNPAPVGKDPVPVTAIASPASLKSWASLVIGDSVEVRRAGEIVCAGRVDDVSLSGNVLWVRPAAPAERQLFVAAQDFMVRRL
jgi:hypothetical protein